MKRRTVMLLAVLGFMGVILPAWRQAAAQAKVDCWIEAPTTASNDPLNIESIEVQYRNKGNLNACNLMIKVWPLPTGVTLTSGDTSWAGATPLAPSTTVSSAVQTFNVAGTVAHGTILDWQVTCEYQEATCVTAQTPVTATAQTQVILPPTQTVIGDHSGPANYSPDGTQVVYSGWPAGGPCCDDADKEIIVYDIPSGTSKVLTSNDVCDSHPSFSRDGKQILFQRYNDSSGVIALMNADGTEQRIILDDGSNCGFNNPEWTPDGRIIVKKAQEISVMDTDGSNRHPITEDGHFQNYYDMRSRGDAVPQILLQGPADWRDRLQIYNIHRKTTGLAVQTLGAYGHAQTGQFRPWRNQVVFKDNFGENGNLVRINGNGEGVLPLTARSRVLEYQLSDDENTVTVDYPNIISIQGVWLASDANAGTKDGVNYFPNGEVALSNQRDIDTQVPLSGTALTRVGVLVSYTYMPELCSAKPSWDRSGDVIAYKSYWDDPSYNQDREGIFLMQADGSNKIRLTFGEIGDGYSRKLPQISATGENILFSKNDASPAKLTLINLPVGTNARTWVGLGAGWSRPSSSDDSNGGCGVMNVETSVLSLLLMLSPLGASRLRRILRRGRQ